MNRNLGISIRYTLVSAVLLGVAYPVVMTVLARVLFPEKANGQLVVRNGQVSGSRIIGQPFTGVAYFHSRPSAAGTNGYDASSSGGSNLGPTSKKYVDRVATDVLALQAERPGVAVPVDLVTTSASGLDPDITPAAAEFQIPRVAKARGISQEQLRTLVAKHTQGRQLGVLGEPRVNVLELNLDLDQIAPVSKEK